MRPEFARMMNDIRAGKATCVIVKDLSRLGRNMIESGEYIEQIFPRMGVRFISVTDRFDSLRDDADISIQLKICKRGICERHFQEDSGGETDAAACW